MQAYFFYIFSFITVSMVILMIVQKNPISSALCLIGSFFGLAAIYAMLQAHFVAVLQILVYAGAIMVLFVFVIMLLNLKKEDLISERLNFPHLLGILSGAGLFIFLAFNYINIPTVSFVKVSKGFGTAESIGKLMFSKYVIPFEIIGVLLLVGIIGAVLLGKKQK